MRHLLPLALALVACRDNAPPPRASARIQIEMDTEAAMHALADPTQPAWSLSGTWAVREVRDAWTSAPGEKITIPVPLSGAVDVATAVALQAPPGADREHVRVVFDVTLESGKRATSLARVACSAHDAAHAWREVHARADVPAGADAHLVLTWHVEPSSPSNGIELRGWQACWGVPRVARAARSRLNVLVLSVDTLRADHMTSQGYARPTTPNIDALAARGVRFDQAIATAPWTLPSYGSLFTGLLPARHRAGVSTAREAGFGNGTDIENGDYEALAEGCATLASRFHDAGFATAGIVSNPYFDAVTRIDRGFDTWTQYLNRAAAGVELARAWIAAQGDAPWFLFLHLFDPHAPYTPPPPWDERFSGRSIASIAGYPPTLEALRDGHPDAAAQKLALDMYDGEIAYTDAQIANLIAFLDARADMQRTLVVLHSDHGEELWDHGSCEHGHALHEELLHVPLAFVMEGRLAPGTRIAQRTSLVDACPTILELCQLPVPKDIDGTSLVPLLEGRPMPARPCISETLLYGPREAKAWSTGAQKLVTDGAATTQLFDLAADRAELHDLAGERAERARVLREGIVARWSLLQKGAAGAHVEFDRDRRAELEKYGYPGNGASGAQSPRK